MIHEADDAIDLWYNDYYTVPPAVVLRYSIIFSRIYLCISYYDHSRQRLFH